MIWRFGEEEVIRGLGKSCQWNARGRRQNGESVGWNQKRRTLERKYSTFNRLRDDSEQGDGAVVEEEDGIASPQIPMPRTSRPETSP